MSTEATDRAKRSSRTPRRVGTAALIAAALAGTAWAPADAMSDDGEASGPVTAALATDLVRARAATAEYAADLDAAIADGYQVITPNMPQMGYHYLNPNITDFDITKPPILVYVDVGSSPQLAAFEWVWPETPAVPPLDGATYGSFAAACHYADGTFITNGAEADCAPAHPDNGSRFGFWHPDLGDYARVGVVPEPRRPFHRRESSRQADHRRGHLAQCPSRERPGSSPRAPRRGDRRQRRGC